MSGIKVFAPASIGNFGVGFDIMGAALESPGDEIVIKKGKSPGLVIENIIGDNGQLSKVPELNTAGKSALCLLKYLGKEDEPISIDLIKKMPLGSGLGSSAASAVAGAFAINEYFRRPLSKPELLPFALEGEKLASGSYHADNVGPSLLGGLLVFDPEGKKFQKIYVPEGLFLVVLHIDIQILTKDARALLRDTISLKDYVGQSSNLARFICAMFKGDFDSIKDCFSDIIIEPQRASLIPHFYGLKKIALDNGALGFSISGAGPSVFAIAQNTADSNRIASSFESFCNKNSINAKLITSKINQEGAKLL